MTFLLLQILFKFFCSGFSTHSFFSIILGVFSTESLLFELAEAVSGKQQVASDDLAVSSLEIGQRHLEKRGEKVISFKATARKQFSSKGFFLIEN